MNCFEYCFRLWAIGHLLEADSYNMLFGVSTLTIPPHVSGFQKYDQRSWDTIPKHDDNYGKVSQTIFLIRV